jgi:hypothetical protein
MKSVTLTNGPKPAIGILGQALDFDAVDDLVSVNASASLNDLFSANGGTLSAWVNPRSMGESDFSSIIGKDDAGPSNEGWKLSFGDSGGGTNRVIFTQDYSTTGLQRRSVDNALNLNEWQYLVVTWDGTNNASNVHIYRNGIEVLYSSTINGVGTFGSDALEPLSIGNFRAGTLTFDGLIDDVRIYNYARSPAQIAWDYNRGAPIAHYEFDTCSGTIAYDESDNRYNGTINPVSSGNTAVGTCSSGTATEMWNDGTNGKFNASLGFDGTDDYVQIADTANLRFDSSTQDFSLFTWVKRTTTGTEYILSKEDADNDGWRLMLNASNQVVCSQDATDVTSTTAITDTNWHLIGCTIDRDGNGQVYIDGIANGSTSAMGTDTMATTSNIRIGTRSYTSTSYFNGLIDDVRIYNYVLTPAQIRTVYNQNSAVRFGPLTGSP